MSGIKLKCYISPEHQCAYLPERLSRNLFIEPEVLDNRLYSQLIRFGFRRSGRYVYQPHCATCTACIPIRVDVNRFSPRRRHRRCLRVNEGIALTLNTKGYQPDYEAFCSRYLNTRHPEGGMESMDSEQFESFLSCDWSDTHFLELRLEGKLMALAVTDLVSDGASAVYTFFDPGEVRRSLGTYAILRQIEYARDIGLTWLYLGYWINDSMKMAYKRDFEPFEIFDGSAWETCPDGRDPTVAADISASATNRL